jgi:DNA-binding transcriptional regulator YdaS (Cro superfamily)
MLLVMNVVDSIRRAVELAGGTGVVARALDFKSDEGVRQWIVRGKVPPEHVIWLSARTGYAVLPHEIAPTIYPHPTDGVPQAAQQPPAPEPILGEATR